MNKLSYILSIFIVIFIFIGPVCASENLTNEIMCISDSEYLQSTDSKGSFSELSNWF